MPHVRVFLFGYPRVEFGNEVVAVPRRKALALLAYLCVTQSHHSRDVLASLLWPEEESAKSYAFLRNALWVLHQTPLAPWILATRHMVGLRADESLWVDVVEFRRLLQTCSRHKHPEDELCREGTEALRRGVELAPSGFLAGFTVDDSRAFEEWQYSESDLLVRELSAALGRLSATFEAAGDTESALRFAQHRLSRETLDEGAYRTMMRLEARRGDRAAALRMFDECTRVLDAELGLTPSEETIALAKEIRTRAMDRPTAKAPQPPRHEFPAFRSALVGRENDAERILQLLDDESCRLITITGVGGSGKTRLAVDVAGRATRFTEGAVFVSLVDVESPSLVPAAILRTVGAVPERDLAGPAADDVGPAREAARQLAERDLLVVLDNAEHLAHDPRWLGELLDRTTRPKFLLTSRQELAVRGEWIFALEGLASPPPESQTPAAQFPSVQLFLQAARRADARFSPTPKDLDSISSVARHLQGSPLGLELAASWVRTMSCRRIETEILKSVDFLQTDERGIPRRHRSLRAAFLGSWDLLDRAGRDGFRTLSVFRGGFTVDSAFQICAATPPILASLVAKSLVARTADGRYEMLQVVREYAQERLRAVPEEATAVSDRHADYFLALLASQESRLKRSEQLESLEVLTGDEANVYAAWRHAAAQGSAEPLARSAMSLFLFCDMTSRFAQAADLFHRAGEAVASARGKEGRLRRATFHGYEGWFAAFIDPEKSAELLRVSLEEAEGLPLDRDLAFILVLTAFCSPSRVPAAPHADAEKALEYFENHGFTWEAAAASESLAFVVPADKALSQIERSLAMRQSLGDHWGVAMSLCARGMVLALQEDLSAALHDFAASAEIRARLGLDPHGLWSCYVQMGAVERKLGHFERSAQLLAQALDTALRVRSTLAEARSLEELARLDLERGQASSARDHAARAASAYDAGHRVEDAARVRELVSRKAGKRKST